MKTSEIAYVSRALAQTCSGAEKYAKKNAAQ
jgi:hypothetical protein